MKSHSLFDKSWYYHRPLSVGELKGKLVELVRLPHVSQASPGNSFNRLVISKTEDFLLPSFFQRAIGYPSIRQETYIATGLWSPDSSLHTALEWTGYTSANLEFAAKWMSSFIQKNEKLDILRTIRLASFEFEFFINGWPIHVKYRPPWNWQTRHVSAKERSIIIIRPFGWREDCGIHANPLNYDLDDADGIGLRAKAVVDDFLKLFESCPVETNLGSFGDSLAFDFNRLETAKLLDFLIDIANKSGRVLSRVGFQIPAHAKTEETAPFINDLVSEHHKSLALGMESRLSYCAMLSGKRLVGFSVNGVEYNHGDTFSEACYQTKPCAPQYVQEQENYLLEYVDWLAGTARLETVSGAIPAYSLLYHQKDFLSLVALPFGNQFVLCLVPDRLDRTIKPKAGFFSAIGKPKDWRFGKIPIEGDFTLPSLPDRHSTGLGESGMGGPPPFAFQNQLDWVRKAVEEHRMEDNKKHALGGLLPESLETQIGCLLAAGLELSHGVKPEDFLLFTLEKDYLEKPYLVLLRNMWRHDAEGVILCPQAICSHVFYIFQLPDYPWETIMMEDFQRACGDVCRIENIVVNYRFHKRSEKSLKDIRFTANGRKIKWTFGSGRSEAKMKLSVDSHGNIEYLMAGDDVPLVRGHPILVEYFQTFLKLYSDELGIYKTNRMNGALFCLPRKTAEKLRELIDICPVPELSDV